jgi:hypothetical protein
MTAWLTGFLHVCFTLRDDCPNAKFILEYTYETTFNEPVIQPPQCT